MASPTAMKNIGGSVSVLATWGGDEQAAFLAMVKPFEDQAGVKVQYEANKDLGTILQTRVSGGNPPDTAGIPGPGQMATFAKAGKLIDLSTFLDMNGMKSQYTDAWLSLAQVDGKQVGIFIKAAAKGQIWYNTKTFQQGGFQQPKTWDDLITLSKQIADKGVTPWSIGFNAGGDSGWPGTDWLEDIILRQSGVEVYDQWWQGKIKWTSDPIKKAWQSWQVIVGDPKMVYGGSQKILSTDYKLEPQPVFANPPMAYLIHEANFVTGFITAINKDLKPVTDFNYFPFPDIDTKNSGVLEVAGDLFGMFKDTPQARGLISWLTTPEAQSIWVKKGGALSPNQKVSPDDYPDPISKQIAQNMTGAKTVRFDGSDLMPNAMNKAFFQAVLKFVQTPANLDTILKELDNTQASAYKS